jgi:hypothetical protein
MSETITPSPPAVDLPSVQTILMETPLYQRLAVGPHGDRVLKALRYDSLQLDLHCVDCKRECVFVSSRGSYGNATPSSLLSAAIKPAFFEVELKCQRCRRQYVYYFDLDGGSLQKVGQSPSLEDIAGADIEKYRKQLKGGAFAELRRAGGLISHGIGIGAFVYLRRIFERLITEHYKAHCEKKGPVEGFDAMRMDDKIAALSDVLPESLVKHRKAYSILSKGLHELEEDECKAFYPPLRAAIIKMLEDDWVIRQRRDADEALEREMQRISETLAARDKV